MQTFTASTANISDAEGGVGGSPKRSDWRLRAIEVNRPYLDNGGRRASAAGKCSWHGSSTVLAANFRCPSRDNLRSSSMQAEQLSDRAQDQPTNVNPRGDGHEKNGEGCDDEEPIR